MKNFQDFLDQLSEQRIQEIGRRAEEQVLEGRKHSAIFNENNTCAMTIALELLHDYHVWLNS